MQNTLSKRGEKAFKTPLRVDFELFFKAAQNLYHEETNPEGNFTLNVAENKLSWGMMSEKLREVGEEPLPKWVSSYTSSQGYPQFREIMAGMYGKFISNENPNPENMAFSAGATAVIEMTSFVLTDPGDVVVFPAPSYPVYKQDIGNKSGAERYDLRPEKTFDQLIEEPIVTTEDLDQAILKINSEGKNFRMLVLTNPDNPTGRMYKYRELVTIANWCKEHRIHLVVNEIYALSLIDTRDARISVDYNENIAFRSFIDYIVEEKSPFLHLWYSLSKDFGISGLRVGFVYSENNEFINAYKNLNAPHMVSNHTQWLLMNVFKDDQFISGYIQHNQQKLTDSYSLVREKLKEANIPYIPSRGSLFVWIDASEFLASDTHEAEIQLWENIFNQTGVLLTPGAGFGNIPKGHFRIVYSSVSKKELRIAMDRMVGYFRSKR